MNRSLDVTPNLKPPIVACACGCGVESRPRVKAWSDGLYHARSCACHRCRGGRNRREGLRKQRTVTNILGLSQAQWAGANEETLSGAVRTEAKSGGKARPVATAYENARAQSDAARSVGDNRVFVASFLPVGTRHAYFVVRSDDLWRFIADMAESVGGK